MGDRCTGHCCRQFHLGIKIEDLKTDMEQEVPRWDPEESRKLIAMLVPLEEREGFYTCRHLHTHHGRLPELREPPEDVQRLSLRSRLHVQRVHHGKPRRTGGGRGAAEVPT